MTSAGASTSGRGTSVWGDSRLTRPQLLFDLVTAAGFALIAIPVQLTMGVWSAAVAGMLALALAIRRWWLPGMVTLATAAALVQVISGDIAYAADAAYFPLFFTLGSSTRRGVRRFGLVAGSVAVVVAALSQSWRNALRPPGEADLAQALFAGVGIGALCAVFTLGGWLVGYLRWQSRETVQARVDAALEAQVNAVEQRRLADSVQQEAERSRIAADMHDVVAHSWAVVAAQADGARYGLREHPEQAEAALRTIAETARGAMTDVRLLLTQLRGREPGQIGLDAEDRGHLIERMRASGITLHETTSGTSTQDRLLTLTAQRILAEALTNALKHGDLSRPVEVVEDWTTGYRLLVRNAVREPGDMGAGHGLVGIAERAELAGGAIETRTVRPAPDGPPVWELSVDIPATEPSREDA